MIDLLDWSGEYDISSALFLKSHICDLVAVCGSMCNGCGMHLNSLHDPTTGPEHGTPCPKVQLSAYAKH